MVWCQRLGFCHAMGVVSLNLNLRTRWRLLWLASRHGHPIRGEMVPVPIEWRACWVAQTVRTFWEREELSCLHRESNCNYSVVQLVVE